MHHFPNRTYITFNFATPLKRASAPLPHHHLLRLISPTTTHKIAPIHPERGLIADASGSAQYAESGILLAELRRRFHVHQVHRGWRFVFRIVRQQMGLISVTLPSGESSTAGVASGVGHHDAGSALETLFQVVSDGAKVW